MQALRTESRGETNLEKIRTAQSNTGPDGGTEGSLQKREVKKLNQKIDLREWSVVQYKEMTSWRLRGMI